MGELVGQIFLRKNRYIVKQATLAATRIVRKCPDKCEIFVDKIKTLVKQRQNGNLLCCVGLMSSMLGVNMKLKKQLVNHVEVLSTRLK